MIIKLEFSINKLFNANIGRLAMSRKYTNLFRINLAEYFQVDENGLYKQITPRRKILTDDSNLVILSKLDQKIYYFFGFKSSKKIQTFTTNLAKAFSGKYSFSIDQIIFPSEDISPEHLQFLEYFIDDLYLPKMQLDTSKHYKCYFCEQILDLKSNSCSSCGKEIPECFICNRPIIFGDIVGKCNLCGATAHLVHFYEWLKALGMCAKCNQKLPPEGIIPITEENKEVFFE